MSIRTTSDDVIALLQKDYDSINLPDLTGYIASANVVVDRVYTCSVAKDRTLTDTELELIERWLAAHFYATSDRPYKSKSTLKSSASFDGNTDKGLEATLYGQQAMAIDYSGCLEAIFSKRARASVTWLGKPPSEQIEYSDRD